MKAKSTVNTIHSVALGAILIATASLLAISCDLESLPETTVPTKTDTQTKNGDSSLTSLTLSAGTLSPAFASGTKSYTVSVPNATTGITVTPTANASSATIKVRVNGGAYTAVASGTPSGNLALNAGTNTVDLQVIAEDGTVTAYALTVTRILSPDTSLSALTLSAGTLSPVFASDTTSYTMSVPTTTTGITVTPTASSSSATITVRVNGGAYTTVASGAQSGNLALNIGKNAIDVMVTTENDVQVTYTISVTRIKTISKLKLDFAYGSDGNTSGGNIYVAWVEDMDGNVIQNLTICKRLLDGSLTNTALPFWKTFRYNEAQVATDAVTSATLAKQNFKISRTFKNTTITKFKVYFETDRSFDKNDWFVDPNDNNRGDQPATLYSAVVNLADAQDTYALTLEAWTPNEGTIGTLSA
jgi:hypothetical protein